MNKKLIIAATLIFVINIAEMKDFGYLVKIDGDKVYIDITEVQTPPKQNDAFTVIAEGEELFNPVTKKSLGKIETETAKGVITEVAPKYAVGKISSKTQNPKPGNRVKWDTALILEKIYRPAQAIQKTTEQEVIWQSSPIDGIMRSVALGDINSNGKNELLGAFLHELRIYAVKNGKLKMLNKSKLSNLFNLISVETHKFKGAKNAHIFVTGHEKISDRLVSGCGDAKHSQKVICAKYL
jgi:hypothetical protein